MRLKKKTTLCAGRPLYTLATEAAEGHGGDIGDEEHHDEAIVFVKKRLIPRIHTCNLSCKVGNSKGQAFFYTIVVAITNY